jgi:hypothetical protein
MCGCGTVGIHPSRNIRTWTHLDRSTAQALADWLNAMADWGSAEHAAARSHGHEVSGQSLKNLDLYRNASLLFREAYGLD